MRYYIFMLMAVLVLTGCDSSTDPSEEKHSVTLVSPNGNETLYFNAPNNILFDADTPVKLELYRNDILLKEYTITDKGDGGTWTPDILSLVDPGNDLDMLGGGYKICIVSTEDSTICDESEATFEMAPYFIGRDENDAVMGNAWMNATFLFDNGAWYYADSGYASFGPAFTHDHAFTSYSLSGNWVFAVDIIITENLSSVDQRFGLGWYNTSNGSGYLNINNTEGSWIFAHYPEPGNFDIYIKDDIQPMSGTVRLTGVYKNNQFSIYVDDQLLGSWEIMDVIIYWEPGPNLEQGNSVSLYFDNLTYYFNSDNLVFE